MATSGAEGRRVRTTVVVVTWRGAEHITACLDALGAQTRPHRTVVVDNASDDGTAALLARHPARPEVLRLRHNTGYAGGIAAALPGVDTAYLAWLNDDAAPHPEWLAALETALEADARIAAVSSRLENGHGAVQSLGVRLTADGHGADRTAAPPAGPGDAAGVPREVFGFCGGAALLRTAALRAVGGVAAEFFCYYEDTDTAWRLRLAGWRVAVAPGAVVRHHHGASSAPGSPRFHLWNERNRLLMLLRCAPVRVALRELARFAVLTAALPARRLAARLPRSGKRPVDGPGTGTPANFRVRLRCRVLYEVATRLPGTLRQRRAIGLRRVANRGEVWRAFGGE